MSLCRGGEARFVEPRPVHVGRDRAVFPPSLARRYALTAAAPQLPSGPRTCVSGAFDPAYAGMTRRAWPCVLHAQPRYPTIGPAPTTAP